MPELIKKTMTYYLLKGQRNLSIEKAKIVGKLTGTDPIIWVDPARAIEREKAWKTTFSTNDRVK